MLLRFVPYCQLKYAASRGRIYVAAKQGGRLRAAVLAWNQLMQPEARGPYPGQEKLQTTLVLFPGIFPSATVHGRHDGVGVVE